MPRPSRCITSETDKEWFEYQEELARRRNLAKAEKEAENYKKSASTWNIQSDKKLANRPRFQIYL
jgi:hypothetical protein